MTETTRVSRIVVGVDGSGPAVLALRWALGQAEVTGAVVEAVQAWDVPASFGVGPTLRYSDDLARAAEESLTTILADETAAHPQVAVQPRVLRGHAAAVLLDRAKDADLLVVGSHGHGRLAGALLGSVSQYCVQHATCPVVVVRAAEHHPS